MRNLIIAGVLATSTLLGNVAMAQQAGNQPSSQQGVSETYRLGGPVSAGYLPHWSRNPGVFNTMTSNPGFVEHSHGHP